MANRRPTVWSGSLTFGAADRPAAVIFSEVNSKVPISHSRCRGGSFDSPDLHQERDSSVAEAGSAAAQKVGTFSEPGRCPARRRIAPERNTQNRVVLSLPTVPRTYHHNAGAPVADEVFGSGVECRPPSGNCVSVSYTGKSAREKPGLRKSGPHA